MNTRATDLELIDSPHIGPWDVLQNLRLCATSNRLLGGTRIVRDFIKTELERTPANRPLRVLDIGSGICDIPLAISRWARARGRAVDFFCMERSPHAASLAREAVASAGDARVRVIEGDIFSHQPEVPYDCAVGSLFFHHLTDGEMLAVLQQLSTFVRRSILVNDLRRSLVTYRMWLVVSLFLKPALRHDLLLSVRRGFKTWELRRLLSQVENSAVSVRTHMLGRIVGVIRLDAKR